MLQIYFQPWGHMTHILDTVPPQDLQQHDGPKRNRPRLQSAASDIITTTAIFIVIITVQLCIKLEEWSVPISLEEPIGSD